LDAIGQAVSGINAIDCVGGFLATRLHGQWMRMALGLVFLLAVIRTRAWGRWFKGIGQHWSEADEPFLSKLFG